MRDRDTGNCGNIGCHKKGRKEVMQFSENARESQQFHRDDCVVGPHGWRGTDEGSPGINCSQMTSPQKGNGDIGLGGTRLCI